MNNKIIYFKIIFFNFLLLVSANTPKSGLENCISNIITSEGYLPKNKEFIQSNKSELIFIKKLKRKGYDVKGLQSIKYNKYKISKKSKYYDLEIQIWCFEDGNVANSTCDLIDNLIDSSSFFEKPPKNIITYNNYCILLSVPTHNKKSLLTKVRILLDEKMFFCK